MLAREQFEREVRRALRHLYDPPFLRASPLAQLLGVQGRVDSHSRLQRALNEAIQSLEPDAEEPPQSRAWSTYEILFDRYIQQMSEREVAEQLGVCVRHMRRRQQAAIATLASRLWERVEAQSLDGLGPSHSDAPPPPPVDPGLAVDSELARFSNESDVSTDLSQALSATLARIQPLATRYATCLEVRTPDALPYLAVHGVVLSQILLSALGLALRRATGGDVHVSARALERSIEVDITGRPPAPCPRLEAEEDAANLDTVRRLVSFSNGRLTVRQGKAAFQVVLALPAASERVLVLAIDDNPDTLQLLQRYTMNTRYRLLGRADPREALALAQTAGPSIILLDVMMPSVEGWEILARLRQHPLTSHLPVVVCTVLAQKDLALSLGASGFVRKPVTRQAFLSALDQQLEPAATGSS